MKKWSREQLNEALDKLKELRKEEAYSGANCVRRWRALGSFIKGSNNSVRVNVNIVPKKTADEPNTIILSDKYLFDVAFTSNQLHEFEVQSQETQFGKEEFTCDIPNVGDDALKNLDENGIVKLGSTVRDSDILVGKVTPKGESELTVEEQLLRAIFGEKARGVRDSSLRFPYRVSGRVTDIQRTVIDAKKGIESVRVFVEQTYKINVGDILTDIEGKAGIVTEIRSELTDCDIIANFALGNAVTKTHIAEKAITARSIGPYSLLKQQPISCDDVTSVPQRLTYNDLVKLQNSGLIDIYQNMLLFQSKNSEPRVHLYKSIVNGLCSDTFLLPYSDLNRIKAFMAAACIDLVFMDNYRNEITHSISSRGQLEHLYHTGEISLKLRVFNDDNIKKHSYGVITRPETINKWTHRPERDGLFCECIFGTTKDWECGCGKFKGIKYKGTVCDKCGVKVTKASVRYERMGHIELAVPIEHPLIKDVLLNYIPVLPPELRPMVQLKKNLYCSSDLNDLYRRVINRNNRLQKLIELGAEPTIIANEIKMLIEAVDNLFFGGISGAGGRSLEGLLDHIKEVLIMNIQSEPLDYSASCGVCPDEKISETECGVPLCIVIELFKPFIMRELVIQNLAHTIKSAKRTIERWLAASAETFEDIAIDLQDEISNIDELLKIRNMNEKSVDEVESVVRNLVRTEDGIVKSSMADKKKTILNILEKILSTAKIMVLGDDKESKVLLLKPILSEDSMITPNTILKVSSKNYTKLKIALDGKVRIFLAASDVGQELCKSAEPSASVAGSLFDTETETDFVKDLVYEVMNGEERIEEILVGAIESGRECKFATTISRLLFGVPTAVMWKRYKMPMQNDLFENI